MMVELLVKYVNGSLTLWDFKKARHATVCLWSSYGVDLFV